MSEYAILINTSDGYNDCWEPFFKLFVKYWPDCKGSIWLNTEHKSFEYPNLKINSIHGCTVHHIPINRKVTWSQCFLWALNAIDKDIILYMQEDYFLKAPVKNDIIESFVKLMNNHPEIKCIHLTDQALHTDSPSPYEHLGIVARKQQYRISCQAALWRKEELMEIIRKHESAWEFEEFGSQRSSILNHEYLVVDSNWVKLDKFEILPYVFTGIVQGRWYEPVVSLFKRNGIEIDFNLRGFFRDAPKKTLKKRIYYRLHKIPKTIRNKVDLLKLALNHKTQTIKHG